MKYEITQEQVDGILKVMMSCNVPVQAYAGTQDMLSKLPVIKEVEVKAE